MTSQGNEYLTIWKIYNAKAIKLVLCIYLIYFFSPTCFPIQSSIQSATCR